MKTTFDLTEKEKTTKLGIENSHHASPCCRCARDSLAIVMFTRIYQQETFISVRKITASLIFIWYRLSKHPDKFVLAKVIVITFQGLNHWKNRVRSNPALRWIKIDRDQTKKLYKNRKYTAKVGQDNVNIGVVTIFRLTNTSLLQVYWMDKCLLQDLYIYRKWPK